MPTSPSPLAQLRQRILSGETTPEQIAADALARSNSNAGHNVYLAQDPPRIAHEASALQNQDVLPPLYGVPISLKDCFDLRGYITTCGSRFYANINTPATEDSWLANQIKRSGAILTGKTHLHKLAYGITGQNPDYGDCLQPANPALLTGGSSSGAAASVQEGSALAAIGTDTGGSVRVPAALCGLAGFRASADLGARIHAHIWAGAVHLAPSFDTLGLLFRDLRDGPTLAHAIYNLPVNSTPIHNPRVATVTEDFMHDAEPEVREAYALQRQALLRAGATLHPIDTTFWAAALDIFVPLQAHEAATLQRQKLYASLSVTGFNAPDLNLPTALGSDLGLPSFDNPALTIPDFSVFEASIAERLTWGESLTAAVIASLRQRHVAFRAAMDALLTQYDLLLLPCAPMRQLRADADHTNTRRNILRYTTPVSLAGMPAVTIPAPPGPHLGAGMQLVAPRGHDSALLHYAATLT
jgi:Asp-tRNA(Asn)/Glu-tRNA(Gln) amidotransferase A subunit family amidase